MKATKKCIIDYLQLHAIEGYTVEKNSSLEDIGIDTILLLELNLELKKDNGAITFIDFSKAVTGGDILTILEELGILKNEIMPEPIHMVSGVLPF